MLISSSPGCDYLNLLRRKCANLLPQKKKKNGEKLEILENSIVHQKYADSSLLIIGFSLCAECTASRCHFDNIKEDLTIVSVVCNTLQSIYKHDKICCALSKMGFGIFVTFK